MAQDWAVQTAPGRCCVTGRDFGEGEEFYTVLVEEGESFKRLDFSTQEWKGPPEGSFCHFKTRVPVKEQPKQLLVHSEMLIAFFRRLATETKPVRLQLRFVLALILMRKRLLRYDGSKTEDRLEIWNMTLTRDQTHHRVVNPQLTDDQIGVVSRELSGILHSDMGEWADRLPMKPEGMNETGTSSVDSTQADDQE